MQKDYSAMMYAARRPNRRYTKKFRIIRFLGTIMILIGAGWLLYHLLSPEASTQNQNIVKNDTIVRTIQPNTIIIDKAEPELPLLAAPTQTKNVKEQPAPPAQKKEIEPKKESPADKILKKANDLINDGKTIEARTILNEYLAEHFCDESAIPLRDRAVEIGSQTVLSPKVYPQDKLASYYSVKSGDNLVNIARKSDVPYELICRINHIDDPRKLRVGQKLKLVHGPIHLKVIKHELKMYVFLQDVLFAKYEVGLGKNDNTPLGRWLVEDRIRRPLYVDPDTNQVYQPNDKDNPTGGYWLRLKGVEGDTVGRTGFGIHGTTEPDSIGKFMSKGCIRMRNEEVSQVFDMLIPGKSDVYTLP
ncbi:MAG: LysM peptidoglycan-binding domain-containing protein [Phycisphaerae bacterium]|nr:LysM peptidoglycan-binding domain-containing protein [Phycisphaerae bacterium]